MAPVNFDDLFKTPQQPVSGPVVPYTGDGASRYGHAALDRECDAVTHAPQGTRNDTLNRACYNLAQLIASGHLAPELVESRLTHAARTAGLPAREIQATLASAHRAGSAHPRHVEPADPPVQLHVLRDTEPAPDTNSDTADKTAQPAEELTPEQRLAAWRAQALHAETERLRIRRAADRALREEEAAATWREPPWRPTLTAELAIPDQPIAYTVEDALPSGGNVLLTAQFKAGKTTLVNELARCLADEDKFLGRFATHTEGRIALWNYEVDPRQYRRWLREAGFTHTDRVTILNLRGYRMPVKHTRIEDWIVQWLATHDTAVWVLDPFARAFVGSGTSENDNTEVGTFLDTLDVIKERAGIGELVLPTHTGRAEMERGTERARGATRLDDWADVRWLLTRDETGARYFRATGRDVEIPEGRLDYEPDTRRLTLAGGDRYWESRKRDEDIIVTIVSDHPGISFRAIREQAPSMGQNRVKKAIESAEFMHQIYVEKSENGKPSKHFPTRSPTLKETA